MRIGCYSPELVSLRGSTPSPEESLKALETLFQKCEKYGYQAMQFNFLSAVGEEMPDDFPPEVLTHTARLARAADVQLISVNGTFNMVHPVEADRQDGIRRFGLMAQAADELKIPIITLCTGSRSLTGMWSVSPENRTEESYQLLLKTTEAILPYAEKYNLTLGVEIEASNVIYTAERAQRYLKDIASPHMGIILDCANLFYAGTGKVENVRPFMQDAFDRLGDKICLAHGKDIRPGDKPMFANPTEGMVDYPFFRTLLDSIGYQGPMVLHGFHEEGPMPAAIAKIREIFG
ncbi:MAG: sugar phosphate isomerase/epimerase [Clostridia bacterium]|nr:sugar phosphate isomerase/epimerase [Clostridia bacterium]